MPKPKLKTYSFAEKPLQKATAEQVRRAAEYAGYRVTDELLLLTQITILIYAGVQERVRAARPMNDLIRDLEKIAKKARKLDDELGLSAEIKAALKANLAAKFGTQNSVLPNLPHLRTRKRIANNKIARKEVQEQFSWKIPGASDPTAALQVITHMLHTIVVVSEWVPQQLRQPGAEIHERRVWNAWIQMLTLALNAKGFPVSVAHGDADTEAQSKFAKFVYKLQKDVPGLFSRPHSVPAVASAITRARRDKGALGVFESHMKPLLQEGLQIAFELAGRKKRK